MMKKQNLLIMVLGIMALVSVKNYKLEEVKQLSKDMESKQFMNDLNRAKQLILSSTPSRSFKDLVMATMEFVHNNSLHKVDSDWEQNAFNIPLVIQKLISASSGANLEKPHLSCGPRAYAMRMILDQLGITSRLIGLSSDNFETIEGHRLLEVYNQNTGQWETWDPDFGVTYIDKVTNNSVDIMRLIRGNLDEIVPTNRTTTGWKETNTQHLKDGYFEMALFENFTTGMKNSVIIVNTKRFDTNKVFKDNLNVYQWSRQNYGHPRLIKIP